MSTAAMHCIMNHDSWCIMIRTWDLSSRREPKGKWYWNIDSNCYYEVMMLQGSSSIVNKSEVIVFICFFYYQDYRSKLSDGRYNFHFYQNSITHTRHIYFFISKYYWYKWLNHIDFQFYRYWCLYYCVIRHWYYW